MTFEQLAADDTCQRVDARLVQLHGVAEALDCVTRSILQQQLEAELGDVIGVIVFDGYGSLLQIVCLLQNLTTASAL